MIIAQKPSEKDRHWNGISLHISQQEIQLNLIHDEYERIER